MTPDTAINQCGTEAVFQPAVPINTVPVPETPAQICALYGFTCLGSHDRQGYFSLENNPILKTIIEHGHFPSDEFIRKWIPRPFLNLEGQGHKECTMEEMYYYWRVTHQIVRSRETPVFIAEVTELGLVPSWSYYFGKPIGSKALQAQSCVIFNHLRYPIETGSKVFVHNFEIAELVPPDFPL